MTNILVVGDLHLREKLGYSDYIKDRRIEEEKQILDAIYKESERCQKVVFLGDQLNGKNNPSSVIKKLVAFIERFNDGSKEIYILAGNHEKFPDGRTALDFYGEIKNPNLHIISKEIEKHGDLVFSPYFYPSELGAKDCTSASKKLAKKLTPGVILFCHQSISDVVINKMDTNTFNEILLPKKSILNDYSMVIAGHVHSPFRQDNILIAGSVFNNEVGESGKFVYIIEEESLNIEQIKLPGRGIYKVINPTTKSLKGIPKDSIIKAIITEEGIKTEDAKKLLSEFDAYMLIESIKHEREKVHYGSGESILDWKIEDLLKVYSENKKINLDDLKHGFSLIQ